MKKSVLSMCVMAALALMMSFSAATLAAPNPPATKAVPAVTPNPKADPAAPPEHPEIRAALMSLRRAKDHLEHADHDFNGHRVDAVKAVDEAIKQLEICVKFDK
jgi:hypothetical protein